MWCPLCDRVQYYGTVPVDRFVSNGVAARGSVIVSIVNSRICREEDAFHGATGRPIRTSTLTFGLQMMVLYEYALYSMRSTILLFAQFNTAAPCQSTSTRTRTRTYSRICTYFTIDDTLLSKVS